MKPHSALFLALGVALIGVGVFFHYKGKKDHGGYFFFGSLALFLGLLFS